MLFKVNMYVSYKEGILDPVAVTTTSALQSMNYKNVAELAVGKYISYVINAESKAKAETQTKEMAEKLLTNPIIERYKYSIEEA